VRADRSRRILRGLRLHFDNARSHTARFTREAMEDLRVAQLPHPAWSPDLSPADFSVFGRLKKHLQGQKFTRRVDVIEYCEEFLNSLPITFWQATMSGMINRYRKVISSKGEYFERPLRCDE